MEFLWLILGAFVLLLVVMIVFHVITKNRMDKAVYSLVKKIPELKVEKSDHASFSYRLTFRNKVIYASTFVVPSKGNITVNNRYIWQIIDGGKKIRTVEGVKKFMDNSECKIALLYPSVSLLRRWVNESEMIYVKGDTDIFGSRIAGITDYELIADALADLVSFK